MLVGLIQYLADKFISGDLGPSFARGHAKAKVLSPYHRISLPFYSIRCVSDFGPHRPSSKNPRGKPKPRGIHRSQCIRKIRTRPACRDACALRNSSKSTQASRYRTHSKIKWHPLIPTGAKPSISINRAKMASHRKALPSPRLSRCHSAPARTSPTLRADRCGIWPDRSERFQCTKIIHHLFMRRGNAASASLRAIVRKAPAGLAPTVGQFSPESPVPASKRGQRGQCFAANPSASYP